MSAQCEHPDDRIEVRKFPNASRSRIPSYRRQCMACGARIDGRKLDPFSLPDGIHPRDVQWAIRPRKRSTHLNSEQRKRRQKSSSKEWREQRLRVLERDDWTCRGCGEEATEVHHAKYGADPLEDVPDEDLQASCGACNLAERNERMAGGTGGRIGQTRAGAR